MYQAPIRDGHLTLLMQRIALAQKSSALNAPENCTWYYWRSRSLDGFERGMDSKGGWIRGKKTAAGEHGGLTESYKASLKVSREGHVAVMHGAGTWTWSGQSWGRATRAGLYR